MSSDKRLLVCIILSAICFLGVRSAMVRTGLIPPEQPLTLKKADKPKLDPAASDRLLTVDKTNGMVGELPGNPFMSEEPAKPEGSPADTKAPEASTVARAAESELVLGANDVDDATNPYRLRLQLDQVDASVSKATSSRYDAEFDTANRNKKPGRLVLIQDNPKAPDAPGSLAIFVSPVVKGGRPPADGGLDGGPESDLKVEAPIKVWEVVRDKPESPAVRVVSKVQPTSKLPVRGQEIHFRNKLASPSVEVTKVFRIWEGEEGFEVDLRFQGSDADAKLSYRLIGPHGIPIEGEWYTSTFRDVFFGQSTKPNTTEVITRTAYDAVKYAGDPAQQITSAPLAFAGVEDQYFATLVQPWPTPRNQEERWDASSDSYIIKSNPEDSQKADVTVAIDSKPIAIGPNLDEVIHSYRVYAGPKTAAALLPFGADELSSYRKNQWVTIPFASSLAKGVIAPLLDKIYWVTESVSKAFGGTKGNYGIAIILLTMTVRLIMFPIGRKQAMMAKKMQDLQPILAEVKEKYKDDKDALTRETMAVWKRHKVNPAAGCLPALIQMPIFVGLWQSLNNSVELRHSSFLYIRDLAAPDMLFRFPTELPIVGQYFNVLPFLVVALMLVQTKLFSPPPTTPEAEAQQKMMKYMMVFMAFMFYKVPSGLGLYFITSSLWQIGERLLLPKIMKTPQTPLVVGDGQNGAPGGSNGSARGPKPGGGGKPNAPQGWLGQRLEKLLDEAAKDKTIRNTDRTRNINGNGSGGTNGDGNRPRSKPPGKRR